MNTIIYFSPTGNVRYLAKQLTNALGSDTTETLALEFSNPEDLKPKENLIIMYSIHAFNPPRTVRRFVKNIPPGLYGNISIISVGCTDMWINAAASRGIRKKLERKGYSILVDEVMAMPLTLVMQFPDDLAKKQISAGNEKIEEIAGAILQNKRSDKKIPIKSRIIHFFGKAEGPAARLFGLELYANKSCTQCGICVKNCPEHNIRFNKKNKVKIGLNCLMCMRCIYNCPEKAIKPRISRFLPINTGYSIEKWLDKE